MIVCCGEALIDMLPRQLETGEDVFLPTPGGAIFNTAITLGRLDERAGFLSGISRDMFGEQLLTALKASNVDTGYCVRKDCPSTLAFVKLNNGQAQYTFMDENSAGRMFDVCDLPNLGEEVSALHFGAISLIPEPCGTAYETLMRRHCGERVISLDPNIRPGFISDPKAHRARISRMVAMADIIKVSDEDLDWMAQDVSPQQAIDEMIHDKGVAVVILTKGAQGVEIYTMRDRFNAAARDVAVVDTIGAGDSFNGGFLTGLKRSNLLTKSALAAAEPKLLRPAVEFAIKVAALTVSRAGANPPWTKEM